MVSSPNPANINNTCFIFVANGVQCLSEQLLEKTEDIEICLKTKEEVIRMLENEEVKLGKVISALWRYV